VHAHLRALVEGGRFEVQDDGRRVEGHRPGTPPDLVRKLRRGQLPIDGRIDLHGETSATAPKALEQFLRAQRARGERCVLVVHGKGDHSPGRVGILRGEMSAWLSQGPASVNVAAFTTAREEDGGEGAVYVLLTR
jgi:DNA-nicking Smr family endonuclease